MCESGISLPKVRANDEMTLHAIRETREKMHFGITEAQTRTILEKEMAKTGLVGGDGLVLFGGTSSQRLKRADLQKTLQHPTEKDRVESWVKAI
jgi:hypothetical protein